MDKQGVRALLIACHPRSHQQKGYCDAAFGQHHTSLDRRYPGSFAMFHVKHWRRGCGFSSASLLLRDLASDIPGDLSTSMKRGPVSRGTNLAGGRGFEGISIRTLDDVSRGTLVALAQICLNRAVFIFGLQARPAPRNTGKCQHIQAGVRATRCHLPTQLESSRHRCRTQACFT